MKRNSWYGSEVSVHHRIRRRNKYVIVLLIFLFIAGGLIISSGSSALISPHNEINDMGNCTSDCHYVTRNDAFCISCHNNDSGGVYTRNSAPKVSTHSSANTSSKYGTWNNNCRDCHCLHEDNAQYDIYRPLVTLVTGTITSILDNGDGTSTFGYSGMDVIKQE